ncbi:unnamed protein product [Paramecium pentaurelia]|uniref:Uncharacterized protein n=1 Tax=Paramecium pentaurelia TaxID=43138 RepID=A0A8S1WJK3_9CILI|nr:unnamed protein product [Paramecium pentaurelia]
MLEHQSIAPYQSKIISCQKANVLYTKLHCQQYHIALTLFVVDYLVCNEIKEIIKVFHVHLQSKQKLKIISAKLWQQLLNQYLKMELMMFQLHYQSIISQISQSIEIYLIMNTFKSHIKIESEYLRRKIRFKEISQYQYDFSKFFVKFPINSIKSLTFDNDINYRNREEIQYIRECRMFMQLRNL